MRAWTGPEEKKLIRIQGLFSLIYCAEILNRSINSIERKVEKLGVGRKPHGQEQAFFAEDIANMLELVELGFTHSQIAMCFNSTRRSINSTLSRARKFGFEKYPKREAIN